MQLLWTPSPIPILNPSSECDMPADILRLNMWSGPRNVSTALMYSFAQRSDTRVIDEPLYGHYLRVSSAAHPGANEVMSDMECNGENVIRDIILGPCDRPVLFMKQMAHHLVEISRDFFAHTHNILLTRDPVDMLPSLVNQLKIPTLRDTGYKMQAQLLSEFHAIGQKFPVLDSRELLKNPRMSSQNSATPSTYPLTPQCSPGKPDLAPKTEYGRNTGITTSTNPPAFNPIVPKPNPFPIVCARSSKNVNPITISFMLRQLRWNDLPNGILFHQAQEQVLGMNCWRSCISFR